ncbi:MAG: outer membrane protein assembly factor BamE [Acidobacteria bacterium]|nr:outer membrane protein assembly factor BamE [Acidobacteriota bacterium]
MKANSSHPIRQGLAVAVALCAVPVAFYTYVFDCWAGTTRDAQFDTIVVGLVILLALAAFALSRKRAYLLLPTVIAVELVALNVIDFSPVKPALRAVDAIQPGMSESQVRSILDRAFPAQGRFRRPDMGPLRRGVLSFVLDLHDGRYNAAVVEVTFHDGKVVRARFPPD